VLDFRYFPTVAQNTQQLNADGRALEEEEISDEEELTIDAIEEEELVANQLSTERNLYNMEREVNDLAKTGKKFGHPSFLKYGILALLAVSADLIDAAALTGIGVIVSTFSSVVLNSIIFIIFITSGTEQHNAGRYVSHSQARIQEIIGQIADLERNIAHLARRSMQVSKFLLGKKRFARLATSKAAKGIEAGTRWLSKSLKWGGLVAETIPAMDLGFLPLTCISVLLSYLDERKSYKNARTVGDSISEQFTEASTDLA